VPKADDFVGPPQESPYDKWTEEQRARFDKALEIVDGIKLYRSAGGLGVNAKYAPAAAELERRGFSTEEATQLARYRMWKQGVPLVPTGERPPPLTEEQIQARAQAFVKGTPEERARMLAEDKAAIDRSAEGYFDSLVMPKKAEDKPITPEKIEAARQVLKRRGNV
jgi:hypothetical protein